MIWGGGQLGSETPPEIKFNKSNLSGADFHLSLVCISHCGHRNRDQIPACRKVGDGEIFLVIRIAVNRFILIRFSDPDPVGVFLAC